MRKNLKYISPITFLISLFLIIYFKPIPSGKLWSNYSVLYVSVEQDDNVIIQTLEQNNIKDYVCLSNQFLPINISNNSIEFAMFRLKNSNDENEYHNKRKNYFFDKSSQYRLYYIPNEQKSELSAVVNTLNNQKINCGVDASSSYPFILILVALALIVMFVLFTKNKYIFISLVASPFIYLFCNPFYPVAISLSFQLLTIFYISNIWKRKNFLTHLISNRLIQILLFISLLCAFSSSVKSGFFFLLEIIAVVSVGYTYFEVENFFRQKKSFIPVPIKSARMINMYTPKVKTILSFTIASTVILIAVFFLNKTETYNSHFSKLLLPSNSSFPDEKLSQFEDYYKWTWDIKTAPYKSLNKEENPTLVEYPKYVEDEQGLIRETKIVMAFNQNFKENTFNDIDALSFNSIEKVLKSESTHFYGGYSSSSSYHTSLFGTIMCFICFFILLFLYFYIIIRKENKKEIKK